MITTPVASLYRLPITLWVEDPVTRAFLDTVWADKDIDVRTSGGGRAGVTNLVSAAQDDNPGCNVFGFIDRDFSTPNTANWGNPDVRVFRTEAHEIEGHLLVFDALAAVAGCTPALVEQEGKSYASHIKGWMICKAILAEIRHDRPGFPSDAKLPPTGQTFTRVDAVAHITAHSYWQENQAHLNTITAAAFSHIDARSLHYDGVFDAAINGGTWPHQFSAKEILRYLRSRIPGLDPPAKGGTRLSPATRDQDLGRRLAQHFRRTALPPFFVQLRDTMRAKAGI